MLRLSCLSYSYAVWRTFKQMDRCRVISTFTLKKNPGLKIVAGDTPFLCTDLVLIRSNSRAGCWVLCEHKYLEKHDKQSRGGEDLEKKSQTLGNTRGECFSENLRHCREREGLLCSLEEQIFISGADINMHGLKPACLLQWRGGCQQRKVPFARLTASKRRSPYTHELCVTRGCCRRNQTPSPLHWRRSKSYRHLPPRCPWAGSLVCRQSRQRLGLKKKKKRLVHASNFYIMIHRVNCCLSCTLKPVEWVLCLQRSSLAETLVNNGLISLEITDCTSIQLPICNTTMTSRVNISNRAVASSNDIQT